MFAARGVREMANYRVSLDFKFTRYEYVEADSPKEAEERAVARIRKMKLPKKSIHLGARNTVVNLDIGQISGYGRID